MNYELALKLKNAGFPQEVNTKLYGEAHRWQRACPHEDADHPLHRPFFACPEIVKKPPLSELIEACGFLNTGMDSLHLYLMPLGAGWKASASKAVCFLPEDSFETKGFCSSPEEAFANLFLELHKNV